MHARRTGLGSPNDRFTKTAHHVMCMCASLRRVSAQSLDVTRQATDARGQGRGQGRERGRGQRRGQRIAQ
eukprot:11227239-Alexandrium_andersonii.AAC.1